MVLIVGSSLVLKVVAVQADVVQDFDGGGSTYTLGGVAAVAGVGNPGNGLRLTPSINVAYGVAAFDLTDPGTFDRIQIDFDFRFSEFRNNDPANAADGFGVALLHTGTFGSTGLPAALNSYGAYEEPDFANSFGVGFDTWDNSGGLEGNSSVSIHFNGTVLDSVVVFPDLLLENGLYNHASILLDFVPGGTYATVSVLDASDNVLGDALQQLLHRGHGALRVQAVSRRPYGRGEVGTGRGQSIRGLYIRCTRTRLSHAHRARHCFGIHQTSPPPILAPIYGKRKKTVGVGARRRMTASHESSLSIAPVIDSNP